MGKLLTIKPDIQWPWGQPFHVHDGFNGKNRGEWYYRDDLYGIVRGPFKSRHYAQLALDFERTNGPDAVA